MAKRKGSELFFDAITIEGALITPEQVTKIAQTERTAKVAEEYGCPKGTKLGDEISRYFLIGQAIWRDFSKIDGPNFAQSAAFAEKLLRDVFGCSDLQGPLDHHEEGRRFRLAFEARDGRIPIVVAPPRPDESGFTAALVEFGDGPAGGRAKRSPIVLLQDWLNADPESYWGLVFVGDRVRLMRDNASLTRAAWIEADLGAIFRDEMFADFSAWWLLTHASRFGKGGAAPSDSPLEKWREAGLEGGTAARDRLRDGVEEALAELGQGAIEGTPELKQRLEAGVVSADSFFEELLRTIYRIIFLAVTEERGLLHAHGATQAAKTLYASGYGFQFWRERSARSGAADGHHDAWEAFKVVFRGLEKGEDLLGLPALGGLFLQSATPNLDAAQIPNRNFLKALYRLSFLSEDGQRARINWRDMKTEEFGSVYESLLEIRPRLTASGVFALDSGAKGNKRKTTGSYYTPDSLVETLLDSALDPILNKAEANRGAEGILDLKVIDPACGSGHFLLGAARRMADRVAELRNPDAPDRQAALRDVVARCIHGVDRNPMAVELAKVALWIESVSPGQPLGFLDANIRCGDALLGVFDLEALEQGIPDDAYKPLTGDSKEASAFYKKKNRDEKKGQGSFDFGTGTGAMPPRKLAANLATIRRMPEDTVGQVERKRGAFEAWRRDPARWNTKVACDLYTAAFLLPKTEVPENYQPATVPTTADVWKKLGGGSLYAALEAAVLDAAEAARAFHWPLAFPDVLISNGGFDVVLGNPPWEVVQLSEKEYFGLHVPEVAELNGASRKRAIADLEFSHPEIFAEFAREKRASESVNEFARTSGRFSLTANGKVNTYGLFAELFLAAAGERGSAGVIVPTGIATDATNAPFFGHLVSERRVLSVFDFENRQRLFQDVDSRMKFCLLTVGSDVDEAQFSFFLTDPAQLEDIRRRFTLSPADIENINPNTKTAPVFRSRKDAELIASIYDRVPVLIDDGMGGKPGEPGNSWGIEFRQGLFNMTSDSGLFRTAEQLAAEGWERQGTNWVRCPHRGRNAAHLDLTTGRDASASEQMYVPLYEAKMFNFFDHRYGDYSSRGDDRGYRVMPETPLSDYQNSDFEPSPFYWTSEGQLRDRLSERSSRCWLLAFKDVTAATNERTSIFSAIPQVAVGHTAPLVFNELPGPQNAALLANFNALTLDFCARTKVAGLHMTYGYVKQFPILPPSAYSEADLAFIVPRVLELSYTSHSLAPFARDLGYEGPPFRWDEDRRAQLRAELDAWYALAYGLSRDELRYVLDPKDVMGADYPSETFRVLQNSEMKQFGEYRTRRLVLAAYDELLQQGMLPRTEGHR